MILEKYSMGVGDRFAREAEPQLKAFIAAEAEGAEIAPVWNKSHREHTTIGSKPGSARAAADEAVAKLGWKKNYYVDADHIRTETVDGFLSSCNFYTIDVAEAIGSSGDPDDLSDFLVKHGELARSHKIPDINHPVAIEKSAVEKIARQYVPAAKEAGRIYRHIANKIGSDNFVTEVSMDETDKPQTPDELLVILAALSDEKLPLQTIAPKFTGRFNKGVDYAGDIDQFEREFNDDLAVIAYATLRYGLPENLKLSVHSGSDKFSIYAPIHRALKRFDAGLHLKTAGTTWLEEIIGIAEGGEDGLKLAKEIYAAALEKRETLCAPYAAVIDIRADQLASPAEIESWSAQRFAAAVRHDQTNPLYNPSMRQLLHVAYKIAAHLGERYYAALEEYRESVARNVFHNIYARHLSPVFLGK